jgi:hypothetical protein
VLSPSMSSHSGSPCCCLPCCMWSASISTFNSSSQLAKLSATPRIEINYGY